MCHKTLIIHLIVLKCIIKMLRMTDMWQQAPDWQQTCVPEGLMNASVFWKAPLCIKKKRFILRNSLAFITTALFSSTFPSYSHTTAQCFFSNSWAIFSHCYLCQTCAAHVHSLSSFFLFSLNYCNSVFSDSSFWNDFTVWALYTAFCGNKVLNIRHHYSKM